MRMNAHSRIGGEQYKNQNNCPLFPCTTMMFLSMIESTSVERTMPAETLRCPSCGAAVSSAATRCDFCKAVLATVTCPSCFQTMFAGAKFCSHCGAKGNRSELAAGEARLCPRCQIGMKVVTVGTTSLLECDRCDG